MTTEIEIPSRIAGRVSVHEGEQVVLRDFFGRTVTLTAEHRQEGRVATYMLVLRRDAPEFDADFEAFLVLKATLLVASVRDRSMCVKRLSYIDHRVIDEFASPEDRRFIRREYLMRKLVLFDNDDWNDARPSVPPEPDGWSSGRAQR